MQKLRSIQVLRGLAAFAVLDWHARALIPTGAAGVDLFFVISGFIIGKVAVGRTAPEFLADRLWRVLPPYWIAALPWFAVAWWGGFLASERIASSVTLWPWWGGFAEPYLRPGWTLTFELLFYVTAAAALLWGRAWMFVGLAIALIVANLLLPSGTVLDFIGCPLIAEFLAGLAIGRLPPSRKLALGLLPLAAALLATAPASNFVGPLVELDSVAGARAIFWGIPAAIIVYSALAFEDAFAGKWAVLVVYLGDASYALYLTHFTTLQVTSSMVVCVIVAICFHHWIEKPLLGLRKWLREHLKLHLEGELRRVPEG